MGETENPLVFVSYYSGDREICRFAELIATRSSQFLGDGIDFFVDSLSIKPGEEYEPPLRRALERMAALVFLASEDSSTRMWVNVELGVAWFLGKPILPVLFSKTKLKRLDLPETAKKYQPYRLEEVENVGGFMKWLAECPALAGHVRRKEKTPPPSEKERKELVQRVNYTLGDVRADFGRMRKGHSPVKITIKDHQTMELWNTYLDLEDPYNKNLLGPGLHDLLRKKYDLVRVMWNPQEDWTAFETEWQALDRKLEDEILKPK